MEIEAIMEIQVLEISKIKLLNAKKTQNSGQFFPYITSAFHVSLYPFSSPSYFSPFCL